jgi:hypothetical protein
MKQNKILILSLIIAIIIVNFGCQKDKTEQPQKKEILAKDNAITLKILNFKEKLFSYENNGIAKGHEGMTIDSAVWYTEALLNYTYDEAISHIEKFSTVIDSILVPTANGHISYNDLHWAYVKMNNIVKKHKNDNPDAKLLIIDVMKKDISNGEVKILITTGLSQLNVTKTYWLYDDAAELIQYNINSDIAQPTGNGYWTDIDHVFWWSYEYSVNGGSFTQHYFYNPNWDEQYFNYYRYLIFENLSNQPLFHIYLDDTEINNYTYLVHYCISDYIPEDLLHYILDGKSLISCNLYGEYITQQNPEVCLHLCHTYYGVWVPTGGGGEGK